VTGLDDLKKKRRRNYEWPVGLFNKLFSTALRRVLGWLSGLF
jgi:hypothetical protein